MTPPLPVRLHLMITFMMALAGTFAGASLGLALSSGRILAVVGAVAGGLGAGIWALLSRRQVVGFFQELLRPVREISRLRDEKAEAHTGNVVAGLYMYQAARFPLAQGGVSAAECEARRTVAYQLSAYEGLPRQVQVAAAAALEAIDQGKDAETAAEAMSELRVTVYEHRGGL
ncbi:hypothetical protein [Streptomyces sp. G-G2]|uniref:hypothetical protein n=1 Tax=Streptomyces sp. G-G2 TaxID=3046201 RepID=UPI0024B88CD2|nr:hypothetical protein [Streptomyces sp. G-G2]MDJ0384965.1 hypothetical protein [Streptomyces sp. G-G2]